MDGLIKKASCREEVVVLLHGTLNSALGSEVLVPVWGDRPGEPMT